MEKNNSLVNFNEKQLARMKDYIKEDEKFNWEDLDIINKILSKYDTIKLSKSKADLDSVDIINDIISDLQKNKIRYEDFLIKEKILYEKLKKEIEEYNKNCNEKDKVDLRNIYDREKLLDISKYKESILINGDGGVGKSYLLYKIGRLLVKDKASFFISFGKFDGQFLYSNFDEIINYNQQNSFYFIIDALNEYTSDGLERIKEVLKRISLNPNIKVILSYRNNTMKDSDSLFFKNICKDLEYELEGVNIEFAIDNLISQYGINVLKYEPFINFQNPLYLKLLKEALVDKKIKNEEINAFSQITYIYECFLKKIDENKKIWNITKSIVAKFMYDNATKSISEENLKIILEDDFEYYILKMKEYGLITINSYSENYEYILSFDFFNDYLIARWFVKSITNKEKNEIIKIIDEKLKSIYSVNQALIVALFDVLGNNYELILDIISNSELKYYFNSKSIRLIRFKSKSDIIHFQKIIKFSDEELIKVTMGENNKPFNCENYFNYEFLKKNRINLLSNYYSDYDNESCFLKKLKFNLALLARTTREEISTYSEIYNEYFFFCFWLMSSSYKEVRLIARKCVFEYCRRNNNYYDILISKYHNISDDYLSDAIVEIICYSKGEILEKYKKFLLDIYQKESEIYSTKLIYIDNCLFNGKRLYIQEKKENLLTFTTKKQISEDERKILLRIDLLDKDLLPWRENKNPWDECHINLLSEDKCNIFSLNKLLNEKYNCIKKKASNCKLTKEIIFKLENVNINEKLLNKQKIVCLYLEILNNIANKYSLNILEFPKFNYFESFGDSVYCKVVTIALHILEGTLMCNFYTNEFNQREYGEEIPLGYIPYNSYQYEDSFELNYYHPISSFNQFVDELNEKLEERVDKIETRDDNWAKDQENIKSNLSNFIKPIKKSKNDSWIMLAAEIRYIHSGIRHSHEYIDHYIINSSYKSDIILTGTDDRYITIEWRKYKGAIEDYYKYQNSICTKYTSINNNSNVLPNNDMALPPANLLVDFNLKYCSSDSTWRDGNNNILIISDNNNSKYYKNIITKTIYIRSDLYNKIKNEIKYYSFTSRSLKEGYIDESEFHYEFDTDGKELKSYRNSKQNRENKIVLCDFCKYNQIQTKEEKEEKEAEDLEKYRRIVAQYKMLKDEILEN